jgi:hypothetical protein
VACGDGQDAVTADPQDEVDGDCERLVTAEPSATGGDPAAPATGAGGGQGGAGPGAGSNDTSDSGRTRARTGVAKCSSRGSRRTVVCSVRLLDRSVTGAVDMQLRKGPVAFAQGRGRVVRGVARVRMRARLPLVGGRYTLRLVVHATGRHKPIQRVLGVGVLSGAPV